MLRQARTRAGSSTRPLEPAEPGDHPVDAPAGPLDKPRAFEGIREEGLRGCGGATSKLYSQIPLGNPPVLYTHLYATQ